MRCDKTNVCRGMTAGVPKVQARVSVSSSFSAPFQRECRRRAVPFEYWYIAVTVSVPLLSWTGLKSIRHRDSPNCCSSSTASMSVPLSALNFKPTPTACFVIGASLLRRSSKFPRAPVRTMRRLRFAWPEISGLGLLVGQTRRMPMPACSKIAKTQETRFLAFLTSIVWRVRSTNRARRNSICFLVEPSNMWCRYRAFPVPLP